MNAAANTVRALLIAGILVGFTWNPTVAGESGEPLMCEFPEPCPGGYGGLFCLDEEEVMEFCDNGDDCWVSCGGPWVEVNCGGACHPQ